MVKHRCEGPERLSAYGPKIDNPVIGSDVVESGVVAFSCICHLGCYNGSDAFRPTLSN